MKISKANLFADTSFTRRDIFKKSIYINTIWQHKKMILTIIYRIKYGLRNAVSAHLDGLGVLRYVEQYK